MADLAGLPGTLQREIRQHPRRSKNLSRLRLYMPICHPRRPGQVPVQSLPGPVVHPVLCRGVAFNQNAFYGALFIALAILLFIVGMHFGRK